MSGFAKLKPQGMVRDVPAYELGDVAYSRAQNVVFSDGAAERVGGVEARYGATNQPPLHLLSFNDGVAQFWLYAGGAGVGVTDLVTHYDITPTDYAAIDSPALFTSCDFNGLPVLSTGAAVPYWWSGVPASPMVELPNFGDGVGCAAIRPFRFHLVALSITTATASLGSLLRWSSSADPGAVPATWEPAPENDAGDLNLASTPGALIDGAQLGGVFMAYKQHAAHVVSYVGGQFIMGQRTAFPTTGVLSTNCVASVQNVHFMLTDGDIIRHDSNTIESIATAKIRREFFARLDSSNYNASYVVNNRQRNEVWFIIPEAGDDVARIAYVYHWPTESWGLRVLTPGMAHIAAGIAGIQDPLVTWDQQTATWADETRRWGDAAFRATGDTLVGADSAGSRLHEIDVGYTNNGAELQAELERQSMDFGSPEAIKLVTRIWPRIVGTTGDVVQVRIGSQMAPEESVNWSDAREFRIGVDRKVDVFARGRLISVRFSTDRGQLWQVQSFDVEVEEDGRF